jgi:hypothetical protein
MLENFGDYWNNLKGDPNGRHELVKLIVERAYMDEDKVVKMTLKSNYHLVLGHNANGPTEYTVDPSLYACGSDGGRPLTCIMAFLPKHIAQQYVSQSTPYTNILSWSRQALQAVVSA